MAGRIPKPTALKVVSGNPGKRALSKSEPDPTYLQDLTPPAHLAPAAAVVWRELAQKLRDARVLTEVDTLALEMMCNAVATYRLATMATGDNPLSAPSETGGVALNPWAIVQSMAYKQATGLMREFGMTPAARSRVMINPQGDLFGNGNDSGGSKKQSPERFFG